MLAQIVGPTFPKCQPRIRIKESGSRIRIKESGSWVKHGEARVLLPPNPKLSILAGGRYCLPARIVHPPPSPPSWMSVTDILPHSQSLTQLLRRTKQLRQLSPCCCPPRPHTDAPEIQFWTYSSEIFSRLSDGRMYFFVLANFCISCLCKSIFVRDRVSSPTHVDRPPLSSWSWKASPAFTFSFNAFLYFTLLSTSYFFFFTFRPTFFL